VDAEGNFTAKRAIPFVLPQGRWVRVRLGEKGGELQAGVDGKPLPSYSVPGGPVQVLFRGHSSAGRLRITGISLQRGAVRYTEDFSGRMPWLLFLVTSVAASALFAAIERVFDPRAAAGVGAALFLVACGSLALYRTKLAYRYPLHVDLHDVPSHIATKQEILARLRALPPGKRVLLWLGGSQAWGAGASSPERTAFSRLHDALGDHGLEWVNGAASGTTVAEQREALSAVASRRRIALVVLVAGVNDAKNRAFPDDLAATVRAVRGTGAKLLLVPEPVEPPAAGEPLERQKETLALAEKEAVPAAALQPVFDARADEGYFWWDFVHLTDAGAEMEARALGPALLAELGRAGR
jgi:lysophospholipase L1-like esterase